MSDTPTTPATPRRPKRRRFTFNERVNLVDLLVHDLKSFDCRFTRLLGNLNADVGLTRARLRILDCVIRNPGWNISRIAYDLDLTRQTVQRTIQAMQRAGLIDLETGRDRRALYPKLAATGRVLSKVRLTQAHEWSHRLTAAIDTVAISAARWLFSTLRYYLPEKLDVYSIDPERLPSGMPTSFEEARLRLNPRTPKPLHPIIRNGGDRLWVDRAPRPSYATWIASSKRQTTPREAG